MKKINFRLPKLTKKYKDLLIGGLIVALILTVVALLIYIVVSTIWTEQVRIQLLTEPISGQETTTMKNALNDAQEANIYSGTFCFWLYLNSMSNMQTMDVNYIMSYEIPYSEYGKDNVNFDIIYGDADDTSLNRITVRVKDTEGNYESIYIDDIYLQKWMCIEVIINNTRIDIYVDGELKNSKTMKYVPLLSDQGNLYIGKGNGFDGRIAQLSFFNYALDESDIVKFYNKGISYP